MLRVTAALPQDSALYARYRRGGNRIAVRFQYESHDAAGQWFRSYGNELWEFDADGYMMRREASINDVPIAEGDRRIFGPRPQAEHGQSFPLR
jgi:nuclear transport factor 2 (NTF2) superfamily protein